MTVHGTSDMSTDNETTDANTLYETCDCTLNVLSQHLMYNNKYYRYRGRSLSPLLVVQQVVPECLVLFYVQFLSAKTLAIPKICGLAKNE